MENVLKNHIERMLAPQPDNKGEETGSEKKYVRIPEDKHTDINIDFDKLLLELRKLENEPGLSRDEITKYETIMYQNSEQEERLLNRIIERAKEKGVDTEQFKALNEVLALDIIEEYNIKEDRAQYNILTGKIQVSKNSNVTQALSPGFINHCLIREGQVNSISVIHHEKIHRDQCYTPRAGKINAAKLILKAYFIDDIEKYKKAKEVIKELGWASIISLAAYGVGMPALLLFVARGQNRVKKKITTQKILEETQAFIGQAPNQLSITTTSELAKQLREEAYKLIKSKKDVDKLVTAVLAVKRLYALNLSDKEIGVLVRDAKWDEERVGYDLLEDKISELTDERGLDMDDLDNMVLAKDLKRKIDMYKIKFIAQEEFKKTAEEIKEKKEPTIIIKKSNDAPSEVKENPFYDPEFWGQANSPDDIYLPDSDEAISFAMAAHEIGHLVKGESKSNEIYLDDFDANLTEEQRAWDKGWEYLHKYIDEYYQDTPENVPKIQQAYKRIKDLIMQATVLSKDMFLKNGALNNLSDDEKKHILKEKREIFFSERGDEFKTIFDDIKKEKIGQRPDWDKFVYVVKKAVQDILRDNEKTE